MLLLRAFYDKFKNMQDDNSQAIRKKIEGCIWKTNAFEKPITDELKINSEVATDDDKYEFLELLKTGVIAQNSKSKYVKNYKFFEIKIDEFLRTFPGYFPYLPARILNNCILLPIEAESQDTALRIFSTLNNRGLPLADADIFKAQFYKYYSLKKEKESFIKRWKELEETARVVFQSESDNPMDEIFARYMYYLRAKEGNKSSTTEALRKFYEKEQYKYLNQDNTLENIEKLADFWKSITEQDTERFSISNLKKLFVLRYAPNSMWQNITSVYFLQNKNESNELNVNKFDNFLDKIIAFIYTYALTNPGVNALRTPIYDEMVNIVENKDITFDKHKFNEQIARTAFNNYLFSNQRNITRSIITWYAFSFDEQELLSNSDSFQIEHIYAKKRQELEKGLTNANLIESLGNKVLLESKINIKASDYRFEDKQKIYKAENRRGNYNEPSKISEVIKLANLNSDFNENNILSREKKIIDAFFDFVRIQNLIE